jgi:hypothetical protein
VRYTSPVRLAASSSIAGVHGVLPALLLGTLLGACEPAESAKGGPTARAPGREPVFANQRKKADYDRGVAGMRAIDALRGRRMDDAMATDLEFKCATLRDVQTQLATERDPIVWRLRTTIDKTCRYDVPLACALFAIDRMERKRAGDPSADLKGDCNGLRIALGDVGSGYLENPPVVDAGAKFLSYCGSADTVKVVRIAP